MTSACTPRLQLILAGLECDAACARLVQPAARMVAGIARMSS